MADELLDLVNAKDEIVGEVWKSKAHGNPRLIHREIAIIVYNNRGQILFQKRSRFKSSDPEIWTTTAAGHVGKGESPETAAHRELLEELGFDTPLTFYKKMYLSERLESRFFYWFTGEFPNHAKITIQKSEVEEAKFMNFAEFEKLVNSGQKYSVKALKVIKDFWKTIKHN